MALALAATMMTVKIRPCLTYRNAVGRERIDTHFHKKDHAYDCLALDLNAVDKNPELAVYVNKGIDYLVDFAQDDLEGFVASTDIPTAQSYFNAHIGGRTYVLQLVSRMMLGRKKGRMIYISSTAAERANRGQGFYAAAKRAVEALYNNLGIELAAKGVTAAILRPGYVDAGRGKRYMADQNRQTMPKIPLARPLTVEEVTQAIMFLLSDGAVGFNATVLTLDGGLSSNK